MLEISERLSEAVGDWRYNQKYYERIQGIVMDTRYLMYHYTGNPMKEKVALAECIEAVLGRDEIKSTGEAPIARPVSYTTPKTATTRVAEPIAPYTVGRVRHYLKSVSLTQTALSYLWVIAQVEVLLLF